MSWTICGVDEAGRGPVIGPMVVAGVMVETDQGLRELKVRDSKKLTAERREELAPLIWDMCRVEVIEVWPQELDELMSRRSLNQIEAEVFARLIESLHPDEAYVDACDANARSYANQVLSFLSYRPRLVCEHKADDRYPIVSAASIIAKTRRDQRVREIEMELGEEIGSGYCSDPKTKAFLQKCINEKGDVPPHTRRSWATSKRALSAAKNSKLSEWE